MRMLSFSAAVSTRSTDELAATSSTGRSSVPIVGLCTMTKTYAFFVISSRTAVKSGNSISSEWNSSRTREHECLNALTSSEVRSYRVALSSWGSESVDVLGPVEVAMTRKVVRSKRMTSVAPQAREKIFRCLDSKAALGMRVWTMLDQAYREGLV